MRSFTILIFLLTAGSCPPLTAQTRSYSHNATSCERCHAVPSKFGSSPLTVQRAGTSKSGYFIPAAEGGVYHRYAGSYGIEDSPDQITGDRVTLSLVGDGYIEAIDGRDIQENANRQRRLKLGIAGAVVNAPVLESQPTMQTGRFGWKSQHSSLLSACADSLRNELGTRNRLYPDEYSTHKPSGGPSPLDIADAQTGQTGLDRLVAEVRQTPLPARDPRLTASRAAQAGEGVFSRIGCSQCHVPTYKTLPPGTPINGGTYTVTESIGNTVIHPYSDFLLHDLGTGDGIPQAAKQAYLDQSTANKFRTAPLWGLRFRFWLMHDGKSDTYDDAIRRHGGEATAVRRRYSRLTQAEKEELKTFLKSL